MTDTGSVAVVAIDAASLSAAAPREGDRGVGVEAGCSERILLIDPALELAVL